MIGVAIANRITRWHCRLSDCAADHFSIDLSARLAEISPHAFDARCNHTSDPPMPRSKRGVSGYSCEQVYDEGQGNAAESSRI